MGGSLFVMDMCDLNTVRLCLSEKVDYFKASFLIRFSMMATLVGDSNVRRGVVCASEFED